MCHRLLAIVRCRRAVVAATLLLGIAGCSNNSPQSESPSLIEWTEDLPAEEMPDDAFMPPLPDAMGRLLRSAESIELFSLDPAEFNEAQAENFRGWKTLGRTTIQSDEQSEIANQFVNSIPGEQGIPACFLPRHGLRFSTSQSQYDCVVCFECASVKIYQYDETENELVFSSTIRKDSRGSFNSILASSNIPLPEPPMKETRQ